MNAGHLDLIVGSIIIVKHTFPILKIINKMKLNCLKNVRSKESYTHYTIQAVAKG